MPYNKGIAVHVKAAKGDPALPEYPPAPAAIIDEEWDLPPQAKAVMVQLDPSEMFCISCEVKAIDPMPQRVIFKVHANNKERALWQVGQKEAYKSEWVYTLGGETPTSSRTPEGPAAGGKVPRLVKKASRLFSKKQKPEKSQQKYITLRVDAFRMVEKEEGFRLHEGELFDEPYASFYFYCYQWDEFNHLMPNATAASSIYEDAPAPGLGARAFEPMHSPIAESVSGSPQMEEEGPGAEPEALPALKAKKSWAQGLRETFSRRARNA